MVMWGANADQLDGLAALLDAKAAELDRAYRQLGRQLYSAPWRGSSADRFRNRWSTVHGQQVGSAASYLRAGSRMLHENARQQRDASGAGTGSSGQVNPSAPSSPDDLLDPSLAQLDEIFSLLGLPKDVIKGLLLSLGILSHETLKQIIKQLKHPVMIGFVKNVGAVIGVAAAAIGFVQDLVDHSTLPPDEMFVHAAIETGLKVGEDLGTDAIENYLGPVIGALIPIPGGPLIGKAVGLIIGKIVDVGFDAADDHFGITDKAADIGLDAYQYLKEHHFNPGEVALDLVDKGVDAVVDGAENLAADVAHGASNLVKGGERLLSSLNPF